MKSKSYKLTNNGLKAKYESRSIKINIYIYIINNMKDIQSKILFNIFYNIDNLYTN